MKLITATVLASASMLTFAQAATLDLTDAAFNSTFDGGAPASATFDGVTFTITPTARGIDGFRSNVQGLQFGVPGNGMFSMSIVASQDVTYSAISGVDNSSPTQTTGVLFNGVVGATSVFSNHIFGNPIGSFDFVDILVSAGDAFLVSADLSNAPGFNSVFATATIGSVDFSTGPVSTVPLPAGLPLMLAGLGAFGLVRRKR